MKIRLGYVAIALNLENITSSSNLTYKRYNSISSEGKRLNILKDVTRSNTNDLKKILQYNINNNIHFYRLTSKLIPLATHPDVTNWDYMKYFKYEIEEAGKLILNSNMRVDAHPDQFNVLNSIRKDVVEKTIINLEYQYEIFKYMKINDPKLILHIGSSQGGKEDSIKRFEKNFLSLPEHLRKSIIIENDDKVYTASEVLKLCKSLKIPIVLDYHHYICNSRDDCLEDLIEDIERTWEYQYYPPKIHLSSPKDGGVDRKHADYINPKNFISLIEILKPFNKDIDIMLEAKKKDLALFKLVKDIKKIKKDWKWIDQSTLEV